MESLLNYLLPGTLGILFQIIVIKIPALKKRAFKANHPFYIKDYLKDDWITIAGSFLSVFILIVGLDELLVIKPEIQGYIKWLFIFVGFTGSSIINAVFSVMDRKIMAVIDVKSNISDGIKPPINVNNAEGAKEIYDKEIVPTPNATDEK